ncbi:ThuA domain-containing protein [Microlunatus sp. Y2014]|uniref:ThuA domain-containing protein n=1 Tax=Microlunatus sp. Y2014 TaxID=3418488 RepID=UPI003DA7680E
MIRIICGAGRYADPWHPFVETSAAIGAVADTLDAEHTIVPVTPDALGDLDRVDLLVVNVGGGGPDPEFAPDPAWAEAFTVAEAWLRDGGAMLAHHQASNGFPDWPGYRTLLGGEWRPGTSMHPPISDAVFEAVPGREADPLLGGRAEFAAFDERYSKMIMGADVEPVLQHVLDGEPQPVVWRRRDPGLNIIVDLLGHDARSFESPGRRALMAAELTELLRS